MGVQQNSFENKIIGTYILKGTNDTILKVYTDKTFDLKKSETISFNGKGNWTVDHIDFYSLELDFNHDNNRDTYFEITDYNDKVKLIFDPFNWGNEIVLIKVTGHNASH